MNRFDHFFQVSERVEQENQTRLNNQRANVERLRQIKADDVQRSLNKQPVKAPRVLDANTGKLVIAGETLRYESYLKAV